MKLIFVTCYWSTAFSYVPGQLRPDYIEFDCMAEDAGYGPFLKLLRWLESLP